MAWLLAEHKAVLEEKTVHQGTVFKDQGSEMRVPSLVFCVSHVV
jgi:hypothetical protein